MLCFFFFFKVTATTEIYTELMVGSVRFVEETGRQLSEDGLGGVPAGLESAALCALAPAARAGAVSYTHFRAHETVLDLACRLQLEKKKYISSFAPADLTTNLSYCLPDLYIPSIKTTLALYV